MYYGLAGTPHVSAVGSRTEQRHFPALQAELVIYLFDSHKDTNFCLIFRIVVPATQNPLGKVLRSPELLFADWLRTV